MADKQFVIQKLSNHNYHSWRFKMEMLLIRERLWTVISKPRPGPTAMTDEWQEKDEVARATIGLYVDDNQGRRIKKCKSAKEAWDKLSDYHDKCSMVYLLKKLARLELPEGGDVEEHLQEFNELVQRTEDAGQEIPDKLRVALLLVSLPDSYDPLVTAIQQRPVVEITMELLESSLMAEAEKRRERNGDEEEKALRMKVGKGRKFGNGSKQEKRLCNHCHLPGHFWRHCPDLKDSETTEESDEETRKKEKTKAKKASVTKEPLAWVAGHGDPADWFVDSGASRHMTGDKNFFSALRKTASVSVMLADGEKAEVCGAGRGNIVGVDGAGYPVDIELNDVLFVPKLTSGLISVSTLASKGFEVAFKGSRCEIRNKSGEVSALGVCDGSLYQLCTADQAKVTNVKKKLDLLHATLSGPMDETPSGNKFFLSLIDDYTKMTFVYLVRNESDAAGKVLSFVQLCKKRFGRTPRAIRFDGGEEYVDEALRSFLRREGIVETQTNQQGVIEQKKGFLEETAIRMLQDAGLERKYWGEALLTATYIQNRKTSLSTKVSAFEKWYGKKPKLQYSECFGREAWVQVPSQYRSDARLRKLVFVGYSMSHNAYRFVDTQTGRVTISRNMKFVEARRTSRGRIISYTKKRNNEEILVNLKPRARGVQSDQEDFAGYESTEEVFSGGIPAQEPTAVPECSFQELQIASCGIVMDYAGKEEHSLSKADGDRYPSVSGPNSRGGVLAEHP